MEVDRDQRVLRRETSARERSPVRSRSSPPLSESGEKGERERARPSPFPPQLRERDREAQTGSPGGPGEGEAPATIGDGWDGREWKRHHQPQPAHRPCPPPPPPLLPCVRIDNKGDGDTRGRM